jgi:Uri superfamily endonuclease
MDNHITFHGDSCPTGAYILWLEARRELAISFGRFRGGRAFELPAGSYAYAGSAMGLRGATAPAGRLLHHATRSAGQPSHAIREELAARLVEAGLRRAGDPLPAAKRLRWHIDYLLEETAVEIMYITVILTPIRIESDLARWLAGLAGAVPIVAGLGASDAPGQTHLLRLSSDLPSGRDGRVDLHLTDSGFPIPPWFQPPQSQ